MTDFQNPCSTISSTIKRTFTLMADFQNPCSVFSLRLKQTFTLLADVQDFEDFFLYKNINVLRQKGKPLHESLASKVGVYTTLTFLCAHKCKVIVNKSFLISVTSPYLRNAII